MDHYIRYIQRLIERGGPELEDYPDLDIWVSQLHAAIDAGELSKEALGHVHRVFGEILTPRTMHGHAYTKPHGYAGDFEIIDRHYLSHVASQPHLAAWDRYWHASAAARAVRNRKDYFHDLVRQKAESAGGRTVRVLNVASGPGRDVFEFLSGKHPDVHFECIDRDPKAIAYASSLCSAFSDQVTFVNTDVLRFRPRKSYDLIWAAGLFDYFSDRVFKIALRRLLPGVAAGGQLVIGNFSIANPNVQWLRFCDWLLHHRSREQLTALAIAAGVNPEQICIGQEPTGVNLFLHIRV
jgi:extracellular factor (EF) 3-hydroxypalmitic acid methyl ester biosynthesis protein